MAKLVTLQRWTDYGEKRALMAMLGEGQVLDNGWVCHLFQLPSTDPTDESSPTLTVADFTGYATVGFAFSTVADPGGTGNWEALGPLCTFTRRYLVEPYPGPVDAGVSNTVYGYYLTWSAGNGIDPDEVLFYRFFDDGATPPAIQGVAMNVPDVSQITIVPRIGLIGLEDPDCPE